MTEEQKQRRRERARAWYLKNRKLTIERARQWKEENPDCAQASQRRRYLETRDERIASARDWADAHPERRREIRRKWKRANRDAHQASTRQYRERKRGAKVTELIPLPEIAERDDWTCHLCGGDVTRADWSLDHLVPISKGGDHTRANVKLAHMVCNARRGARDMELALVS